MVAFVDFEDSSAEAARAFITIGESFTMAVFEEQQPTAFVVAAIDWNMTTTNQIGRLIPYFELDNPFIAGLNCQFTSLLIVVASMVLATTVSQIIGDFTG